MNKHWNNPINIFQRILSIGLITGYFNDQWIVMSIFTVEQWITISMPIV